LATMATEYRVSGVAAAKMVMHAAKHAHGEVCGVLLGQAKGGSGGEADGAGASSDPVFVEDAVPLFHKSEGVTSPLLEAALAQVDSYAQARGRKVVGFYQANERNDDRELHFSTKRIADVIREKSTRQACILLMNNEGFTALLSSETRDLPFQVSARAVNECMAASDLSFSLSLQLFPRLVLLTILLLLAPHCRAESMAASCT